MRALELFFDDEADRQVHDRWDELEAVDVPSLASRSHGRHRPHVSLTVASGISPATEQSLTELLEDIRGLELCLGSLAVFPGEAGVVYLAAVPTKALIRAHARVAQHLAEQGVEPKEHYAVGSWTPHCTLAQDLSDDEVARAIRCLAGREPVRTKVEAAGLVEITSGEVTPLLR